MKAGGRGSVTGQDIAPQSAQSAESELCSPAFAPMSARILAAVIEPKAEKLQPLLDEAERTGSFDMDVMNTLYKSVGGCCMCLLLSDLSAYISKDPGPCHR